VASADDFSRLESLAQTIKEIPRVEDVSYGQSWVRNYASFVDTLTAVGLVMAGILLSGSLFVIGNSIRAAVAARREEVEILELVGATSSMIRRPFVVEGFAMGAIASICALALNVGLHFWQKSMMESSLVMARIVPLVEFLDLVTILGFVVVGGLLGGFGAWLSVRRINDGWSARQGIES
jgi:cell division transport system permease protein